MKKLSSLFVFLGFFVVSYASDHCIPSLLSIVPDLLQRQSPTMDTLDPSGASIRLRKVAESCLPFQNTENFLCSFNIAEALLLLKEASRKEENEDEDEAGEIINETKAYLENELESCFGGLEQSICFRQTSRFVISSLKFAFSAFGKPKGNVKEYDNKEEFLQDLHQVFTNCFDVDSSTGLQLAQETQSVLDLVAASVSNAEKFDTTQIIWIFSRLFEHFSNISENYFEAKPTKQCEKGLIELVPVGFRLYRLASMGNLGEFLETIELYAEYIQTSFVNCLDGESSYADASDCDQALESLIPAIKKISSYLDNNEIRKIATKLVDKIDQINLVKSLC